jgi:hypothetical protein
MKVKLTHFLICLFLLLGFSRLSAKAENNAAVSIEWLVIDADAIVTGTIVEVEEKTALNGNVAKVKIEIEKSLKGNTSGLLSVNLADPDAVFKPSFYYDKHVMVFLKFSGAGKKNYEVLTTPLVSQPTILDLLSIKTVVYSGTGEAIKGENEIVKKVQQVLLNSAGAKGNMACVEPPLESDAFRALYLGSRVILYVPDNLFPFAKKCN